MRKGLAPDETGAMIALDGVLIVAAGQLFPSAAPAVLAQHRARRRGGRDRGRVPAEPVPPTPRCTRSR